MKFVDDDDDDDVKYAFEQNAQRKVKYQSALFCLPTEEFQVGLIKYKDDATKFEPANGHPSQY